MRCEPESLLSRHARGIDNVKCFGQLGVADMDEATHFDGVDGLKIVSQQQTLGDRNTFIKDNDVSTNKAVDCKIANVGINFCANFEFAAKADCGGLNNGAAQIANDNE